MSEYRTKLIQRFWDYSKTQGYLQNHLLDKRGATPQRPPVLTKDNAWRNILINPELDPSEQDRLLSLISEGERHKWFRSMNSSQALAQSVLGNLAIYNQLDCLSEIKTDEGLPLLEKVDLSHVNFSMEHKINFLGEPHPTSLDGYISGDYQIAIECKFTEPEVGSCSRPRLEKTVSNYEREYCDGSYSIQRTRVERCSLTEIGVLYWRYVPILFRWTNDIDQRPCPLKKNYQLVRNILAIGVNADKKVSQNDGHVILIYDDRNPAFQKKGAGLLAYEETRDALHKPEMLRKCSWQHIVGKMRDDNILPWLTKELSMKYGF
jgi:hypothetical protein